MSLNLKTLAVVGTLTLANTLPALGDGRIFSYSYEPETPPKGELELEQSITLRHGRTPAVGQDRYNQWQFRSELEYGVTDRYVVSLSTLWSHTEFVDPATGLRDRSNAFDGISLEQRYLVLDPRDHAVGLSLYLEVIRSGDTTELEQKLILGQRHGDWKWTVNLSHATEWQHHESEGELEASVGIARRLGHHWWLGLEARDHNELPEYNRWENTAIHIGPTLSYQRAHWWATLAIMPQIYGANFGGDPDAHRNLELEGHERLNARLIFGIEF